MLLVGTKCIRHSIKSTAPSIVYAQTDRLQLLEQQSPLLEHNLHHTQMVLATLALLATAAPHRVLKRSKHPSICVCMLQARKTGQAGVGCSTALRCTEKFTSLSRS